MPYRNNDMPTRVMFERAGHVVTWRHLVGSAAGNAAAGLPGELLYQDRTVTAQLRSVQAFMGGVQTPEHRIPAGLVASDKILCVTYEKMGRDDLVVWRGVTYRVESDAAPAMIGDTWTCLLERSSE